MTARVLRAIRELPPEYIADGTEFADFNSWVVAVNGRVPLDPIKWQEASGWTKLEYQAQEVPMFKPIES